MMNRIVSYIYLSCNPPLELIIKRLKTRIDIFYKSSRRFDPLLVYLKKDIEDLERCLRDKIII